MSLGNVYNAAVARLLFTLILAAIVGACGEGPSLSSKQEDASSAEMRLSQLQKQADSGDADAQRNLGAMYAKGEGVPKDATKAVEWYGKAAAQGNTDAQVALALMYREGTYAPKDYTKAAEWFQKAAEQGNAVAQTALGFMYMKGDGVREDYAMAAQLFQKAAARGDSRAQHALGLMYREGKGVPKDALKAVEWLQLAAAQGNVDAQRTLGFMYDVQHRPSKELKKLAAKGDKDAQRLLSYYQADEGVPADSAKALEWYEKAAEQGDVGSLSSLASIYRDGIGIPKNAAKAAELYQKAAVRGDVNSFIAQYFLGRMYKYGEGVPKDSVLAYAWLNIAAVNFNLAKVFRDSIALNSVQRAEAERLSSNWKPGQVLQRESESATSAGNVAGAGGTLAKKGTGTVFIVSTEGYAVTNNHVVASCKDLRMQGRSELVQVITRDEVSDLALLKMPGEARVTAALAPDPASLRQGQDIVVFGFPLDSVLSSGGNLTPGVVSAITGLGNNSNQIQITAPIQPGSSGSPVMNKKGQVVGVVSMKLSDSAMAKATGTLPQNVNFAISGQTLKAFLDAHKVPYKTGGSILTWEKSLADLGDEARKWTTVVECWK